MQNNPNELPLIQISDNTPVLQGGVTYNDYSPYIRDFSDRLKKNVILSNPVTGMLSLNPAARAYMYNAAGVERMTNKDFLPWEIASAKQALANRLGERGGRFDAPVDVMPHNYGANVADTAGTGYIKNFFLNPMRMTTGSMWVAPNGQVLHPRDNNFYTGDPYDFAPQVQADNNYRPEYQLLQKFGTIIRGDREPMMIDINLKD
jgi:hypothetical protein